jgi:hypothetical protein
MSIPGEAYLFSYPEIINTKQNSVTKFAMLHDSLRVLVYANSKQLARSFD